MSAAKPLPPLAPRLRSLRRQPPQLAAPRYGMTVPTGEQCPGCGLLHTFWVFNPFAPHAGHHAGWVIRTAAACRCSDNDACIPGSPTPER